MVYFLTNNIFFCKIGIFFAILCNMSVEFIT